MKKSDLVEMAAERAGCTKAIAERVYESVCNILHDELQRGPGSKVTLYGIGVFRNFRSKARNGRNPATGEPLLIPAKNYVKFSSAKTLDDTINP